MKVICAPDSFKESLTAAQAAQAMARGVRTARPDAMVELCPIADGGEGTVEAMLAATQGQQRTTRVTGPLGEPVDADWGLTPGLTAIIEMAAAAGLALVPPTQRDPRRTTTFGLGQIIRAALDAGCRQLVLGIGGSATNDGGCGMAQALGALFLDHRGKPLATPICGGDLPAISGIDLSQLDPRLTEATLTVACDVTNPLTGPQGAAPVYGPQKGATPSIVDELDAGLAHLARLLREQLGRDVERLPGAGAAGGLGGGLVAFAGATLRPGIELVLDTVGFAQRAVGCDLCLTGEGRLDGQSLSGKACLGVARAAGAQGVPTIALVGAAAGDADRTLEAGLRGYRVIGPGLPAAESMRRAAELLERAAAVIVTEMAATG